MHVARWTAAIVIAMGSTAFARGEGSPRPLFESAAASASSKYGASRRKLAERGTQASSAADLGDYVAWTEANAAYLEALIEVEGVCERNVRDLTRDPRDLPDVGAKKVFETLRPYLDGASSLIRSRLHLLAYANLLQTTNPTQRGPALEALIPLYYVGP